jgi:drug/metabolite transporter (DMT)-like permease
MHPVSISATGVKLIVLSGILHSGYSIFLQRAYRAGDFSLVYPLARGTGPLLSFLAAVILLGERPSVLTMGGGLVIVLSIFLLTGGQPRLPGARKTGPAVFYGVGCGVFIASYTVADRQAVTIAAVAPLVLDWSSNLARGLLLTPFAIKRWSEVQRMWVEFKLECLAVAILSPLAYILVLTAMSFTPLTYIAPMREVSILIGALIGARMLKEMDGSRRIWAAAAMAPGVIALALG